MDSQGNLYIADTSDYKIREVNALTGAISTVAGNGSAGSNGDGGPATAAEIGVVYGLAVNSQGNLFLADVASHVIREVNASTGMISTIAGNGTSGSTGDSGPATAAELGFPNGLAVDSNGNLFLADFSFNRIRAVNLTSGIITTVAGTGSAADSGDGGPATAAGLNNPEGLVFDSQGNLFIADDGAATVRRVDHATGNISTYAGINGASGSTGDNGPATAAELDGISAVAVDSQDNLFILDSTEHDVRRVSPPPPTLSGVSPSGGTVQGGGTTKISWTSSGVGSVDILLSTDGGGTFPTIIASNVPNTGDYGWSVPANLATTTAEIEVVDHANTTLTAKSAATFTISQPTTAILSIFAGNGTAGSTGDGGQAIQALVSDPIGVAVDSQGNVFIDDRSNDVVREVNASTGVITTIAGTLGQPGSSGDGGPAISATLNLPEGVAVDDQGHLFIGDEQNDVIREVNLSTGTISTVAGNFTAGSTGDTGQATNAELNGPSGVAVDGQGNLFIGDSLNNRVREVNLSTGIITTVAGNGIQGSSGDSGPATSAELNNPRRLTVDAQGNLFIDDSDNNRIREVNLSTGVITTVAGNGTAGSSGDGGQATSAELNTPEAVAVDGQGNLFIADYLSSVIREVDLGTGVITTYAGEPGQFGATTPNVPATSTLLDGPKGLAVDSLGNLFISDADGNLIDRVSPPPVTASISAVTLSTSMVQGGGNAVVSWTSSNVSSVDILLSTDGGSTFGTTIAANVPNSGTYAYNVPVNLATTMGEIKVVDHADVSISSTSGTFSVVEPTTAIISTYAGNGTFGYTGDGGAAVSAELGGPMGWRWTARAISSSPINRPPSSAR